MTVDINDTPNRVRYTATAGQTAFSVPFQFLAATDLKVYQNGVLKTISTHYTVAGAGTSSGTVTLVSGAALSDDILIIRNMPVARIGDYPVSGPFDVASLNNQLDALTMMVRDLETTLERRVLCLDTTDAPEAMGSMPTKAARAGRTLSFDANGNPVAGIPLEPEDWTDYQAASAASAATASGAATSATASATSATASASTASAAATSASASAASATSSASAAASARDAAIIGAGVYVDEPTGRAAVADGDAFKVQGSGDVAAFEYRRVNSTTSTLIATYPSLDALYQRIKASVFRIDYNKSKRTEIKGRPASQPPVSGSGLGNYVIVPSVPFGFSGVVSRVLCNAVTGGNIALKRFTKSGNDFSQVGSDYVISVAAGTNDLDLLPSGGLPVNAGEYLGLYALGIVGATVNQADDGGWYSSAVGSGNVSSFTDSTVTTSSRIEFGVEVDQKTGVPTANEAIALSGMMRISGTISATQTIGRPVSPVDGSASSAGTYIMGDAVSQAGVLSRVRIYSKSAASIVIGIYRKSTTVGVLNKISTTSAAVSIGVNTLSSDAGDFQALQVQAGDFVSVTVSASMLPYASATADGVGWYYSASANAETYSNLTLTTSFIIQVGFDIYGSAPGRVSDVLEQRTVASKYALRASLPLTSGWNHVLGYGQSNSIGGQSGAVINTTASTYHKTFDVGPKMSAVLTGGNNDTAGSVKALVEDDVSPETGLTGSVFKDTGLWTFATHFARLHAARGPAPIIFASTVGKNGSILTGIGAGTPWYFNMIYHVRKAKAAADAVGVPYAVACVLMDHGESDQASTAMTKAKYYSLVSALIDAFNNEVCSITGQAYTPQWLFTTSSWNIRTNDAPTDAINDICAARHDSHLVSSGYRFPHTGDNLHLSAAGQCLKRAFQARAAAQLASGFAPEAIRWLSASATGATLTVRASSPTPLAIDTSIVAAVTNSGFAVSDSSGSVSLSSVTVGTGVLNSKTNVYETPITMILSRTLTSSPVLKYAKTAIGSSPVITGGAAGNIFDTSTDTVTIGGTSYSMKHAAPAVTLPIFIPE